MPQSATAPPPLWAIQPNEPEADYQLLARWLRLPTPRYLSKAARALGCSQYRLRRLSARHNWKARAAAFDRRRAQAANLALDQLLNDETSNWKERLERFRIKEWLLHEQMLEAASDAVREFKKHPDRASLKDIVALYELAFALGHHACGQPLDPAPGGSTAPEKIGGYPNLQAALEKIYGDVPPASTQAQSLASGVTLTPP